MYNEIVIIYIYFHKLSITNQYIFSIIDINECDNLSTCPEHFYCINTYGSFRCECEDGYNKITDSLCHGNYRIR